MKKLFFTVFFAVCAFVINVQAFTYDDKPIANNTSFSTKTKPGSTPSSTPEISGLAASRVNAAGGYFWANCDDFPKGKEGRIFALNPNGSVKLSLKVTSSPKQDDDWNNEDWEDICMATRKENGVDKHYIIVGGFGDNSLENDSYYLYIIEEPVISGSSELTPKVVTLTFRYKDGNHNAESVMYDPVGDQIIIITKECDSSKKPTGAPSKVYATPFITASKTITLGDAVATLGKGYSDGSGFFAVTAADMSEDGMFTLIKSDNNSDNSSRKSIASVLYWERKCKTESFADMIKRAPQYVTGYGASDDAKGEAIAWNRDASGFTTASDATGSAAMNFYARSVVPVIPANCDAPVTLVAKPALLTNTFTHDGTTQTVSFTRNETSLYTFTGTLSASVVGSYNVTVSLKDKTNCTWEDGSTDDFTLPWSITSAGEEPPVTPPQASSPTGVPASGDYWINDKMGSFPVSGSNVAADYRYFQPVAEKICFVPEKVEVEGVPGDCNDGNSKILLVDGSGDGGKLTFTVPNAGKIRIYVGAKGNDANRYVDIKAGDKSAVRLDGLDRDNCDIYEVTHNNPEPVTVTITGRADNKSQDPIAVHSILVEKYNPTLTVSSTEIAGFGYEEGAESIKKSFTISGTQLASGGIKVTAPANYEISKNGTSDWRTELTYSPSSNDAVNGTTVYVRLKKPLSVGNYPGEISVSTVYNVKSSCSTAKQAYTKYVALGGAVTASSIDLSVNLASSEPDTYIYKGSEYKPAISVTNNGSPMASSDYIVSYENNVNAGTATVRITGKPGTIYEGETAETTFTITKRPITITAKANQTKVYGGSDPAEFTYDVSGSLVNGDSFTGSLSRAWGENAGSYAIIQNTLGIVNGNGSDIENYSITFISKDFIITPKTIAVVWQNTTLTYNGNAQKPIAYIDGVGDDKRIYLSVSGTQTNAGKDYPATASFGAANDNYVLSGETTTFTITKATGIFDNHDPINIDHSQDLILDHLNPELKDGYEWVNPNTPVREGNGHEYDVIYTHPSGNYEPVAGKVTVNATPSADSDTSIDDIIIDGNTADRNGNSFSYLTECGKSTATITVNAAANATVTINGTQGNTLETPLQYGFNSINISVRAENGNDTQNYTLTVERRIPADIAFVNHFSGVLTVRGQIAGMGTINTAHWYCNGEQIDRDADKRYVEMTQAGSYYALINSSVFTCEVSHLRSTKAFTVSVSPNPVTAGEPLTVSINRTADELRGAQLQLHSTGGQLLQTVPVVGSETTLIAPAYTGTVVVKLVSALGNKEVKVIVK